MTFPLVLDLAADGVPVAVTCGLLGFSRQAFYAWKAHPISERDLVDAYATHAAFAPDIAVQHSVMDGRWALPSTRRSLAASMAQRRGYAGSFRREPAFGSHEAVLDPLIPPRSEDRVDRGGGPHRDEGVL